MVITLSKEKHTTLYVTATFSNKEAHAFNPSLHPCVLRIMVTDEVANNFSFSESSIDNALPTLKNIPLVTNYYEDEDNFGSHELVRNPDGTIKKFNTYPIGMIPESAKQWKETVEDSNGNIRTFLCSEAVLWKRQKDEFEKLQRDKEFSVSMEVGVTKGRFNEDNVLLVDEFYFTAIAILGDGVRPAFKDASILVFEERSDFQEMMRDIKAYMKELNGGGHGMPEHTHTVSLFTGDGDAGAEGADSADNSSSSGGSPDNTDNVDNVDNTDNVVDNGEGEPANDGSQSNENQPNDNTTEGTSEDGNNQDGDNQEGATEGEGEQNEGENDNTNEQEPDKNPLEELQNMLREAEASYGKLYKEKTGEIEAMRQEHENEVKALKQELEDLRQYKQNMEATIMKEKRQKVIGDFPELADNEEFKALITDSNLTPEEIEFRSYAILGRLNRNNRKPAKQQSTSARIPTSPTKSKDDWSNSPYGELLKGRF